MWFKLLLLAGAGALGTVTRFLLSTWVQRLWTLEWAVGTLTVNTLGCLLAGLTYAALERHGWMQAEARLILMVGFLGAFTTFSALILEAGEIYQARNGWLAFGYLGLQMVLGVLALALGWWLMRLLT